jgi:large subunit ribosomal protein L35
VKVGRLQSSTPDHLRRIVERDPKLCSDQPTTIRPTLAYRDIYCNMGFEKSARPLARCLKCTKTDRLSLPIRSFTTSRAALLETTTTEPAAAQAPPPPAALNPELVSKPAQERRLVSETGQQPVASRRRRHMLKQTQNIPFEQLPFQCFQEARKILQEDRQEKIEEIKMQRERIEKLEAQRVAPQDEGNKAHRLRSMRERLEHTKILADINDPIVKKTFEDKQGMSLVVLACLRTFKELTISTQVT